MRAQTFLLLAVPISVLLLSSACRPDNEADNGSATPTPTLSPTPTGTATPAPTPVPSPVVPLRSFRNGNEIWLCLQTQFNGTVVNIAVEDQDTTTCTDVKLGTGFTSTIDKPHYHALRLDNDGAGLTCDTTAKHWNVDYQLTVARCTGCVNVEYPFDMPATDPFGSFCGNGAGPIPIESLSSYFSATTQQLRVRADVAAYDVVAIASMRIYDQTANSFITSCTSPATINTGGNGLFDLACTPLVTNTAFTVGVTYDALVTGAADGSEFIGFFALPFEASP